MAPIQRRLPGLRGTEARRRRRISSESAATRAALAYAPATPVEVGVGRFVDWYLSYYGAA